MKSFHRAALAASTSLALVLSASHVMAAPATDEARIGYSLGVMVGMQLKQDVRDLDIDSFSDALRDVYAGQEPKMDQAQIQDVLNQLQQQIMAEAQQEAEAAAAANRERGQAFLQDNAAQEGVQVTDSGLQYRVNTAGEGPRPQASSTVKVHYEGRLIDGTLFDSSLQRGQPVSFRVNQVIEGWQEALQLMPVGSEWTLYIPAELAYGPSGAGDAIGPNETLVFEVQLIEIED